LVSSVSTNSREIKCYVCTSSSRLAAQHHRLSAICFHFLFLSSPPMHNPHPPLLHHRSSPLPITTGSNPAAAPSPLPHRLPDSPAALPPDPPKMAWRQPDPAPAKALGRRPRRPGPISCLSHGFFREKLPYLEPASGATAASTSREWGVLVPNCSVLAREGPRGRAVCFGRSWHRRPDVDDG
jgi:hypothetical protein